MPERIQLSRAKGWKMPADTVSVARPGRWGNLYRVDVFGLELALALYRNTLQGFWSPALVDGLSDELAQEAYRLHCESRIRMRRDPPWLLRGKNLACWCKPGKPCHADVLLEAANRDTA
jgi:hypothetical protein